MQLSGQITLSTAGTSVAGPSTVGALAVAVKAHPDNTDTVWLGNDNAASVTSSNGFPLNPGEGVVISGDNTNLAGWRFNADVSGEKLCWVVLAQ